MCKDFMQFRSPTPVDSRPVFDESNDTTGAIGPALQSVGVTQGYYFFNAAPYILTLFIMIASAKSKGAAREVPGELSITK